MVVTLIVVLLDRADYGAGPGTVVARVSTVADYSRRVRGRDGAIDTRYRLWRGDFPVGARVEIGQPVTH